MSRDAMNWAILPGMAKQMPWAPLMMAVLTPITSPWLLMSGPPELPGLRAASVWMMLSMSRPVLERNDRARLLMTPAVTVYWNPYGLPMAMATCPTSMAEESPNFTLERFGASMSSTARSVSG